MHEICNLENLVRLRDEAHVSKIEDTEELKEEIVIKNY